MKLFTFILISSLVLLSACSGKESISLLDDCDRFANDKILTKEEREAADFYSDIFRLDGEIYAVCYCDICDKVFLGAIDCDGNPFCGTAGGCIDNFFINAEYLFTVEGL